MVDLARRWTREQVLALPNDGKRYELLDGELLVTPSPTGVHQRAVLKLYERLHPFVQAHRLGAVMLSPADLDLGTGQLLQPDLFVGRPWQGREPVDWAEFGIPILIAEVLSPSTALSDRNRKRRKFQEAGVGEYWIVDTDAQLIERWKPDDERPEILSERIEWRPDPVAPPLLVDLSDYFGEIFRPIAPTG